ncbi:MAG: hypothetical protein L6R48_15980 [Planctomycetes bacterium]|nr:hypothetical protein [Planctomycetota bacterium]
MSGEATSGRRRRWLLAAVAALLAAALVALLRPAGTPHAAVGSTIPPLTRAEWQTLDGEALLARIAGECQRRLESDPRGLGGAAAVLPEPALTLWLVAVLEGGIARTGFAPYATVDAAAEHAPTLERLAAAYRALGLDPLAALVAEAAGGGDSADLHRRFCAALASADSAGHRLAYARRHVDQLVATP